MKLKIKCNDCHGEGVLEYDNEIGHAVQAECVTCAGNGHFIITTVPFGEFMQAFEGIRAVPVYSEDLVLGSKFLPFELHMRHSLIPSRDLNNIFRIADSLGMEANLIRQFNDMSFYFTAK